MSSNLFAASTQWLSRPQDQRFLDLHELHAQVAHSRDHSRAATISSRAIGVVPQAEGGHQGLVAVLRDGDAPLALTHWSFGQLAQRAGAPAGYLRKLPAPIAADCVNYGLQIERSVEDLGILQYANGSAELRAVTGPSYGRIWNETIVAALIRRFGDGRTGDFRVPGEFGKEVQVTKANTTIYGSDRDMFVFLCDERNRIEMPNRRDGQPGSLARGFFVWNSEVGSATFGVATFLFDYVCRNRIVWGAEGYREIKIRHTASAPDRWVEEVAPALEEYAESSTASITLALENARAAKVDNIDAFLAKRFTRGVVADIKAAHLTDEQRPMETVWDVVTGVTAFARSIPHQDERVALEREAGRILDLAK